MFAKVGPAGRLDAIGQVAIVGFIQIEGENFIFRIGPSQTPGQDSLTQLAGQADFSSLFRREQEIPGQLLGNRTPPTEYFSPFEIDIKRSENGPGIDPWIAVK